MQCQFRNVILTHDFRSGILFPPSGAKIQPSGQRPSGWISAPSGGNTHARPKIMGNNVPFLNHGLLYINIYLYFQLLVGSFFSHLDTKADPKISGVIPSITKCRAQISNFVYNFCNLSGRDMKMVSMERPENCDFDSMKKLQQFKIFH